MKKSILLIAILWAFMSVSADAEHTVSEIRAAYESIPRAETLLASVPDLMRSDPGCVSEEAAESMLAYARFMRWLADVEEPLKLRDDYAYLAQAGAVLLAKNDYAAHELPQPEGFPDELYPDAERGVGGSNIAAINWMSDNVLLTAIEFFQRDEGERNRFTLGHRRWLLSPALQSTGFGLSNAESGMTYVTMYVHDFSAEHVHPWTNIKWPAAGAFPAEFLYAETPWCVILNPEIYDLNRRELRIVVSCEQTGDAFGMDRLSHTDDPDAYWIDDDAYGLGSALIFRPDVEREYEQNQQWHVRIDGLYLLDGTESPLEYDVNMIALKEIPVRLIELSEETLSLRIGEEADLTASVIPEWADETFILWSSSNPDVADVDDAGHISALSAGSCLIRAQGANGQYAECALTVK